ncbi:hypothetical protein ACIPIC_32985 [Streptomyces collinus]|uniref:hypothetical protein n=1 Tax=Streptomyces collinus TaxID=42684 RepID=UPI00382DCE3E
MTFTVTDVPDLPAGFTDTFTSTPSKPAATYPGRSRRRVERRGVDAGVQDAVDLYPCPSDRGRGRPGAAEHYGGGAAW